MTITVPKRERNRLAKAELWMHLAMAAERWSKSLVDADNGRPVAEWPHDERNNAWMVIADGVPEAEAMQILETSRSAAAKYLPTARFVALPANERPTSEEP